MDTVQFEFETGVKTYDLNKKVTVDFNPADTEFAKAIFDAFDEMDKLQEGMRAEVEKCPVTKEVFEIYRKYDKQMREKIDGIFGKPICEPLFGKMSLFAIADGLPVWANLMLAVMNEIETTLDAARKASEERIKKYTNKYKK